MALYVLASLAVCLLAALLWPRMVHRDYGIRQWERRQQTLRRLAGTDAAAGQEDPGVHVRVLGDPAAEGRAGSPADEEPEAAPLPAPLRESHGGTHYGRVHASRRDARVAFRSALRPGFRRKRRHGDGTRVLRVPRRWAPGARAPAPIGLCVGGDGSRHRGLASSHRCGYPPSRGPRGMLADARRL